MENFITGTAYVIFPTELYKPRNIEIHANSWVLNLGIVSYDLRLVNIASLFKNGEKSDPSNKKTVSLTSTLSKVLEQKRIKNIEIQRRWDKIQHGFIQERLCQTNQIYFYEYDN